MREPFAWCTSPDDLADYIEACLGGAAGTPAYAPLRAHLASCAECATIVRMTVKAMRHSEAGALPGSNGRANAAWTAAVGCGEIGCGG
jgi:hypothetical protein